MCLLLACVGVVRGHPIVCVANRDEAYDRAADPPASRGGVPEVWCGLDRRAGGTWLGMNEAGVVVVLTNRRGEEDRTRVSRGLVARGALTKRSAEDAAAFASAWATMNVPNPFSLFAADARGAWFVAWSGPDDGARVAPVAHGLHTLTNAHSLDELPAAEVVRAAHGGAVDLPQDVSLPDAESRLRRVAKSHAPLEGGPRSACCVHADGRGTVSSALLAVDAAGHPVRFLTADGPPCTAPFRDVLTGPR
jgi:uncharacterized protein with NRDE domain